jgi:hypothetical protein
MTTFFSDGLKSHNKGGSWVLGLPDAKQTTVLIHEIMQCFATDNFVEQKEGCGCSSMASKSIVSQIEMSTKPLLCRIVF